ncbi:MAG: condensation domain-containing protein, partial [Cyanobacteria bacterium J06598_3]
AVLSQGRVREVLLTALALTVTQHTQQSTISIDLEGHGREETLVPRVQLARTVGWFTSLFPITLNVQGDQPLDTVTEALRQVPQNGVGYGLLHYLGESGQTLTETPQPEILFNYLGDLDRLLADAHLFQLAAPLQVSRSPRQPLSHPLSVTAYVYNGQLQIDWCYSGLAKPVIQKLATDMLQQIRSLNEDKMPTANDFPLANLNSRSFDKLSALLSQADQQGGH